MTYLYVHNYIAYSFLIITFMLSTLLIRNVFKGYQIASQFSILKSEHPHQYDFTEIQFDYKGVHGQALLTETQNLFSRDINATLELVILLLCCYMKTSECLERLYCCVELPVSGPAQRAVCL